MIGKKLSINLFALCAGMDFNTEIHKGYTENHRGLSIISTALGALSAFSELFVLKKAFG